MCSYNYWGTTSAGANYFFMEYLKWCMWIYMNIKMVKKKNKRRVKRSEQKSNETRE